MKLGHGRCPLCGGSAAEIYNKNKPGIHRLGLQPCARLRASKTLYLQTPQGWRRGAWGWEKGEGGGREGKDWICVKGPHIIPVMSPPLEEDDDALSKHSQLSRTARKNALFFKPY